MIDKTAYFFWQGEQMSWLRHMTLRSFVHHNPDWRAVLYLAADPNYTKTWGTPERQENYHKEEYENYLPRVFDVDVEVINRASASYHPAQNSDLSCWEILSNNNGMFFDMDIVFSKSINDFWEVIKSYDIQLDIGRKGRRIGCLASGGNNSIFKELLDITSGDTSNIQYQSFGRDAFDELLNRYDEGGCVLGLGHWEKLDIVLENLSVTHHQKIFNSYRYDTIYPWDWNVDNPRFYDLHDTIHHTHFGVHWYGGRPMSQKFNLFLTEDNFRDHKNTICHYAGLTY
jgi:hypothetical protein